MLILQQVLEVKLISALLAVNEKEVYSSKPASSISFVRRSSALLMKLGISLVNSVPSFSEVLIKAVFKSEYVDIVSLHIM